MIYDGTILCAHASTEAFLEGGQRPPMWPDAVRDSDGIYTVRWRVQRRLPQFDEAAYREVIVQSLAPWESVCGIRFLEDDSAGYGGLEFGLYPQPQPGGVLADCQLPLDGMSPAAWLALRMDHSEAWVVSKNPPANRIDITRVICHEAGHGIGISHIASGNLMAAMYSAKIGAPQAGDIEQARARYGMPKASRPMQPRTDRAFRDVCKLLAESSQIVIRNADGSEVIL